MDYRAFIVTLVCGLWTGFVFREIADWIKKRREK